MLERMTIVVLKMMMMMMMMTMMTNARILPRMGQDHFLTSILQFIIHKDPNIRPCMAFDIDFVLK